MMPLIPLQLGSIALIGLFVGILAYQLAAVPMHPSPRLGHLGVQRRRALERYPSLRMAEPAIRQVAAWVGEVRRTNLLGLGEPLRKLRDRQAERLTQAGHFLGFTPDDYVAMSFLCGLAGIALALIMLALDVSEPAITLLLSVCGFLIPYALVSETRSDRQKAIRRGLPGAIDLAAMCMVGGLDFPGALGMIVKNSNDDDVVAQELGQMLTSLDLGHTRRQALLDLERRVPIDAVRTFARAVIQAEEKGNPLVEVLQVQAKLSRMQRSVLAEEAASRAGVLLLLPLMLLLLCVLLLLMGPFLSGGISF
jgi:tight adherence protein C